MKTFLKSLLVPTMILVTLFVGYMTYATIITAPMQTYDFNYDFFESLTPEQKETQDVCRRAQLIAQQAAYPPGASTLAWMAMFLVQRKKLKHLEEERCQQPGA